MSGEWKNRRWQEDAKEANKGLAWFIALPDHSCHVMVKYKPIYFEGKEERLKWNPECHARLFWREEPDGPLSIWWRWIESFYILDE